MAKKKKHKKRREEECEYGPFAKLLVEKATAASDALCAEARKQFGDKPEGDLEARAIVLAVCAAAQHLVLSLRRSLEIDEHKDQHLDSLMDIINEHRQHKAIGEQGQHAIQAILGLLARSSAKGPEN